MSDLTFPVDKIRDGELRNFAARKSPERITVFVELHLPRREVQFRKNGGGDVARYVPLRVQPETQEQRAEKERKIAEARKFLQDELGEAPEWLSAASAFRIKANGEQLSRIAISDLVEAILPNRTLSMRSVSGSESSAPSRATSR